MSPSPTELGRLAYKYERLAELRRARADGQPIPGRAVFKAIADEFPGALNELDMLPLEVIDERAAALARAAAGGPVEPWMGWMHAYHALLRRALAVKLRLAGARDVSDAEARALAAEAGVDTDLVRAVARPPEGRIARVVYERLGEKFGISPSEIADALFPRRRRHRKRPLPP